MSETINDFSPLHISAAAKVDYRVGIGAGLGFLIGLKFKLAITMKRFIRTKAAQTSGSGT